MEWALHWIWQGMVVTAGARLALRSWHASNAQSAPASRCHVRVTATTRRE